MKAFAGMLRWVVVAILVMMTLSRVAATAAANDGKSQIGLSIENAAFEADPLLVEMKSSATRRRIKSRARRRPVGQQLDIGAFYHSTDEIYHEIDVLSSHCEYIKPEWYTHGDKELLAVRVSYPTEGSSPELTANAVDEAAKGNLTASSKKRMLIFFGEHARELISPEVGLEFIKTLCMRPSTQKTTPGESKILKALQTTDFLIFPNANPNGRRKVEVGQYCDRVNDRGVDLNRNWGEHWVGSRGERPFDDTYPGAKPWSEGETVILATAAVKYQPQIFLTVHSGSLHMFAPYASTNKVPGEPGASRTTIELPSSSGVSAAQARTVAQKIEHPSKKHVNVKPMLRVIKKVNRRFCQCQVGTAIQNLGYTSSGTCLDFVYGNTPARYSLAVEIFDGNVGVGYASHASTFLEEAASFEAPESFIEEFEAPSTPAPQSFPLPEELSALVEISSESTIERRRSHRHRHLKPKLLASSREDGLFPAIDLHQRRSQRDFRCLKVFNLINPNNYHHTVSHWNRAFFNIIDNIHKDMASHPNE